MSLNKELLKRIKEEIRLDPKGRGYAKKNRAEVMRLLNEPYEEQVTITMNRNARINEILIGISYSPNVIDLQDILDAEKLV